MKTKDKEEEVKVDIEIPDNVEAPPEGYTAEEWQDLSSEEKAGILDSIKNPDDEEETPEEKPLTEEEKAELQKIADEGKTDEEKAAELAAEEEEAIKARAEKEGKTVEEITAIVAAEKVADEAAKKTDTTQEVSDDVLLTFKPTLTAEEIPKVPDKPVEGEEVIPPGIQEKQKELKEKFDDGQITADEYQSGRDKLNRQIIKHNIDLHNAALAEWETQKAATEEKKNDLLWRKEQIHFLNSKPEYLSSKATDAVGKVKSNALFGALNEMVKSITADPANANLTGMQVLIKADKAVKEAFGIKPADKKPAKDNKPPAKKPDIKTLADVPAAATNQDGVDDSFALIDKLTGEKYEEALERMPEKTRQAYLDRVR